MLLMGVSETLISAGSCIFWPAPFFYELTLLATFTPVLPYCWMGAAAVTSIMFKLFLFHTWRCCSFSCSSFIVQWVTVTLLTHCWRRFVKQVYIQAKSPTLGLGRPSLWFWSDLIDSSPSENKSQFLDGRQHFRSKRGQAGESDFGSSTSDLRKKFLPF